MSDSDPELVERTLSGDQQAFAQLVRRFQRLVFNIAYHYLGTTDAVEDIAQEVFLKVYDNLSGYDRSRPLKSWIGRIAANRCIDELRRQKRQKVKLLSDLNDDEEEQARGLFERVAGGSQLTVEDTRRVMELLHSVLVTLPEAERTAYILREIEALEYEEVAQICGVSEPAVRIRVSRARKKLQEQMEVLIHG